MNSIITKGREFNDALKPTNGVTAYGFQDGGELCFHGVIESGVGPTYKIIMYKDGKSESDGISAESTWFGQIGITGTLTNLDVSYTTPDKKCYVGTLKTEGGLNWLERKE